MTAKILLDARDSLEGKNTAKIVGIYADKFLFEDTTLLKRITDQTSLRHYFEQLFSLPQVSFSDIKIFEAEDFAAIEWTWSGMNPANGEPYHVRGVSVMELSDGMVTRESIYYNPNSGEG
jgi:steroid delta-isomerase-like uncharacterized protein